MGFFGGLQKGISGKHTHTQLMMREIVVVCKVAHEGKDERPCTELRNASGLDEELK
ncbi:uncharacterized protein G2W53_006619 [Senna tora]|uniref:Uncharacterized protein n=1 Tax=Senna tora TaxID=362788 RepID=A0A834X5J0_9FABA|nr:uncharacterized protein G2W53_006619 [Senna tora]